MSIIFLQLAEYIPGQATAQGFIANDEPNRQVVLSVQDLADAEVQANGAVLAIQFVTGFVRATATNEDLKAKQAAADLFASDGTIEQIIQNQEIETFDQAAAFAASELARLGQTQYSHDFQTRVKGFKPGQQYTYLNEDQNLTVLVTIESVTEKYESLDDSDENVLYSIKAATEAVDFAGAFIKVAQRAIRPQRKLFTKIAS